MNLASGVSFRIYNKQLPVLQLPRHYVVQSVLFMGANKVALPPPNMPPLKTATNLIKHLPIPQH